MIGIIVDTETTGPESVEPCRSLRLAASAFATMWEG